MNTIKENTVVFPKMKADQSGVLRVKHSAYDPDSFDVPTYEQMISSTSTTTTSSGSNAQGWVNTVSGLFSNMGNIVNGIFGNVNQSKYGTDSYNQARIAEANANAAANSKQNNTGLWIAIAVVALLVIGGFALLISKKK